MYPRAVESTPFSDSHNAEDGLRCEAVWGYARAGASGGEYNGIAKVCGVLHCKSGLN